MPHDPQTLCVPCHAAKTAKSAAERAAARRRAAADVDAAAAAPWTCAACATAHRGDAAVLKMCMSCNRGRKPGAKKKDRAVADNTAAGHAAAAASDDGNDDFERATSLSKKQRAPQRSAYFPLTASDVPSATSTKRPRKAEPGGSPMSPGVVAGLCCRVVRSDHSEEDDDDDDDLLTADIPLARRKSGTPLRVAPKMLAV